MNKSKLIDVIKSNIKSQFEGDSSGHDWYHIERVWKMTKQIAEKENANVFVAELGALLHDIADHKFVDNHEKESVLRVRKILSPHKSITNTEIEAIEHIVVNCSYKGGVSENKMEIIEGKIVQDADKLDAIGAIGIARTFAFGGKFGSVLYDPNIKPTTHKTLESYQKNRTHTINHFYEKLLKLKDLMHTKTAKSIALERHTFMEQFLKQFYDEWNANLQSQS